MALVQLSVDKGVRQASGSTGVFEQLLTSSQKVASTLGRRGLRGAAAVAVLAVGCFLVSVVVIVDLGADRFASDYERALWVLAFSTAGIAAAGLMLIVLVGRASVLHHEQWRQAAEARDLLRETIEALPVGIVVYDREARLTLANAASMRISPVLAAPGAIGRTYEELSRETAVQLEAEGHGVQPIEAWLERYRSKGEVSEPQAHGSRWYAFSEQATPSGRTVGLRVDVTDLKNKELEVERAHGRYQTLVDSLSDVVYELDVETGRFTFVNAAVADVLGLSVEEFVGRHFGELPAAEDRERVFRRTTRPYDHADRTGGNRFRVKTASGEIKHVEVRNRRRLDERGRVISIGVIRDVDERVRLEERLAEETARLRSIVDSAGATLLLLDRDLRIVMANAEFARLFSAGPAPEDLVGRLAFTQESRLPPDVLAEWRSGHLTAEHLAGVQFAQPVSNRGQPRIHTVTVKPVADQSGMLKYIVVIGIDETERRAAEQALVDAERLTTVGEMAATLAHEISQPLQVINVACAAAADELAAESGKAVDTGFVDAKVARIAQQVERATRIVSELRAFVRGVASEQGAPFDPAVAVRAAIDLTAHGVSQSGGTLTMSVAAELPPVLGHVARLEQVLVNLINNACEAGASAIEVSVTPVQLDGRDFVRVLVDDRGPGIAEDILPRLFQSFVTTKPRGKGTGLGLRICRRIVEEMGGMISATNREAGGARFEILLPAAMVH
jgi:PAS domain S-box-containing protein